MDPKLGLLFLTRGDVNHPEIWREFTHGNETELRILSHPKHLYAAEVGFLEGTSIQTHIETSWGHISLVRAMMALLSKALDDKSLTHFVFLSESCVPVKPWSWIRNRLLCDPRSRLSLSNLHEMAPYHAVRHQPTKQIPPEAWRLHSQWHLLERETAERVAAKDLTARFEHVFAADEHYVGTVLALNNYPAEKINPTPVTWVDWKRGYPYTAQTIDNGLLEELTNFDGFFARKFSPASDIGRFRLHCDKVQSE